MNDIIDTSKKIENKFRKVKKEELELVFPTKEYKKEVEEYLQEFLDNGENEICRFVKHMSHFTDKYIL